MNVTGSSQARPELSRQGSSDLAAGMQVLDKGKRTYTFCGTPGYVAPENVIAQVCAGMPLHPFSASASEGLHTSSRVSASMLDICC